MSHLQHQPDETERMRRSVASSRRPLYGLTPKKLIKLSGLSMLVGETPRQFIDTAVRERIERVREQCRVSTTRTRHV